MLTLRSSNVYFSVKTKTNTTKIDHSNYILSFLFILKLSISEKRKTENRKKQHCKINTLSRTGSKCKKPAAFLLIKETKKYDLTFS